MPLVYQQNINEAAKVGVWHITESEDFFLESVFPQKEINHPLKRLQHLAGRYLLKKISPDFPLDLIRVNSVGKPYLENENWHFSISHCGAYAAVIISENVNVGIDIEMPSQKIENIKHKFSSVKELEFFDSINISSWQKLTVIWSIKEAMFKYYGKGQIDFQKHLCIEKILFKENNIIAACILKKNEEINLTAVSTIIDGVIITYVMKINQD